MGVARLVTAAVLAGSNQGWWNASAPPSPAPSRTWWQEKADEWLPSMAPWTEGVKNGFDRLTAIPEVGTESGFDWGIWTLADTLFSLLGWACFGSAWAGVRNGCKRQCCILLGCCIVAHYIWAVCWPVVSLMCAIVVTVIWLARRLLRGLGAMVFIVQKWLGGTPEASEADYYGPGTGQLPETTELRKFKYQATVDKWVVVKQNDMTAVFKVSSEVHPIRSSGVYRGRHAQRIPVPSPRAVRGG